MRPVDWSRGARSRPGDLKAAEVLPPHGEAALQVQLTAGAASVVGYTVEIFYP